MPAYIERNALYVATLPEQGEVLVLVVGRNALNKVSEYILIVPVVKKADIPHTDIPSHVLISDVPGFTDNALVILSELIRPLKKDYLDRLLGVIPPHVQLKVDRALQMVLALD